MAFRIPKEIGEGGSGTSRSSLLGVPPYDGRRVGPCPDLEALDALAACDDLDAADGYEDDLLHELFGGEDGW